MSICPQSSPVPVLVMTRKEGRELLQLVRENSREVEAMVELTSNSLTGLGYFHVHVYTCCMFVYSYIVYIRTYIHVHMHVYV